jgi:hypothetical protein
MALTPTALRLFPGEEKVMAAYAEFHRHLDQIGRNLGEAERARIGGPDVPDLERERDLIAGMEQVLLELKNDYFALKHLTTP